MAKRHKADVARVVSVIAATITSLACGAGYAFSAWGPAFAQRMVYSSTQTNLIGAFGNIGMYGAGIPLGRLVDSRGPRVGSMVGCVCMGLGFFALYSAYVAGAGSVPLPFICFFYFIAGCGSSSAFGSSIKTATMNFPKSRGTASAFPIAAFGLSAFFFSLVSSLALPNDTAGLLLFLSAGTFAMIAFPAYFLRIVSGVPKYQIIPSEAAPGELEDKRSTKPRRRDASAESENRIPAPHRSTPPLGNSTPELADDEINSLSKVDTEDSPFVSMEVDDTHTDRDVHTSLYADIRGLQLLYVVEFYQVFLLIGLLTGIGLMTINNIGNDAQALWAHWDADTPLEWIRHRQSMHVSIISVGSAVGRLCSGIGSDFIVDKLQMSRVWCLVISSALFCLAQALGIFLENPNFLFGLSGISGLAYGFLFGVSPPITADVFGPNVLSQNWGTMTLSPIIFGNAFNMMYGQMYDAHSKILPSGHGECEDGRLCYKDAYLVTFGASLVAILLCLWTIRHEKSVREKRRKGGLESHLA